MERSTDGSEYKVGCPCEKHDEYTDWIECTEVECDIWYYQPWLRNKFNLSEIDIETLGEHEHLFKCHGHGLLELDIESAFDAGKSLNDSIVSGYNLRKRVKQSINNKQDDISDLDINWDDNDNHNQNEQDNDDTDSDMEILKKVEEKEGIDLSEIKNYYGDPKKVANKKSSKKKENKKSSKKPAANKDSGDEDYNPNERISTTTKRKKANNNNNKGKGKGKGRGKAKGKGKGKGKKRETFTVMDKEYEISPQEVNRRYVIYPYIYIQINSFFLFFL